MGEIELVKVGQRGAVIIPFEMRKKLGIKGGDQFLIVGKKGEIVLRKVSEKDFERKGWRFWK